MLHKKYLKKLMFSGVFTLVILIIAEIILSFFNLFPSEFYTGTPHSGFTWVIDSNKITGIHQNSEVAFDALGARSTTNYDDDKPKIVTFGGSTTACFALTQTKTWPALLETKLNNDYWVGNFGRPGNSSNHHIEQFKHILEKPELSNTKVVVIMQGVNDFVAYLISAERYLNTPKYDLNRVAFQHSPNAYLPFHKRFTLFKLASRAKKNILFYLMHKDYLTKTVENIKDLKKRSKIIDELPNLEPALEHYTANIENLIQQANNKKIKLIFVTQATMWKPNLEKKYEDLIVTSGFANNEAFYSTRSLHEGMAIFNTRLKAVCKKNNVSCLDLQLPKTTASFYDDFHFNESGAELASDQIADYLKPLLNQ
ncbi:SGNH/GDSL hydrolase family protein [Algibacter miyuki]|uniref:SGNH/GDSL hydrolase family protein n=1 Tax=Algibacter miyuki TaxID=1306933 RepID=A0ABV5GX34_9FLAO|nr:GDSL-type esterase/lipase family protein [Algibacter miyuki]MDN3664294.1 GDSL-type esterase/lipase family protein [Algibacter miyuki]